MGEYEDYIIDKPERFKLMPESVFSLAKEHGIIMDALARANLTVKEIHDLYSLPDGKYSKTLKTIYRYMDILEQIGLVKLAGHRKTKGKRTLQKLYCRTAKVFFNDDDAHKEEWLQTDKGRRFIDMLTTLIGQLHGREGETEALRETVLAYFRSSQIHINEIIDKTMTDDRFSDTMDKYDLNEIKAALTFVSHIQVMLDSQETIDEMNKLLG
jgi:predicted GNAT family acetyltransferase